MMGNIANMPAQTGANLSWQEFYVMQANGTFSKTRERDGVKTSAFGTYKVDGTTDTKYIRLTYENDNDIIGNCTAEPTETLSFKSESTLLMAEWSMCDGPRLEYRRVKYDGGDS